MIVMTKSISRLTDALRTPMKNLLIFAFAFLTVTLLAMPIAEAKRLGGGSNLGKQYSSPPASASTQQARSSSTPANQASAPAQAPRPAGASRWLGPLAGLAAGGLLASLFFGDGFEGLQVMDFLLMAALIIGGILLFRMLRRGTSPTPVPASASPGRLSGGQAPPVYSRQSQAASAAGRVSPSASAATNQAPSWFDAQAFSAGAKTHFLRLQSAWDKADFGDIRTYTTPELFAELQRERQSLGPGPQFTEVVTLDVSLVSVRREDDLVVASLEFSGLIREDQQGTANAFREIWHIQHEWNSRDGDWFITGIQQVD